MKNQARKKSRRGPSSKWSSLLFEAKLVLLLILFLAAAILFVNSFYHLQIVEHDVLAAKAANQQFVTQKESPRRGMILDRNGYPLVLSSYVYRVGITPADVQTRTKGVTDRDIVDKMGQLLDLDEEVQAELLDRIRADQARGWSGLSKQLAGHEPLPYLTVATEVPEMEAMQLQQWLKDKRVGGVRFDPEERRVYNNGGLATPVLGLTRATEDGRLVGVSGLEGAYDDLLSGQAGYTYERRNNYTTRGTIPFTQTVSSPVERGRHLVSTLDMEVMTILQEELRSVAAAAGLIQGVHGLVMEVKTGQVLAMGQLATFDGADPTGRPLGFTEAAWDALTDEEKTAYLSSNLWNNVNVTDIYEPGSVFKAITLAIALEEDVAWEQTVFNDDPVEIQEEEISCYNVVGHGDETLTEAFYRSCNPVFVHLGNRVGKDLYYEWIRKLGFYGKSGIDLPAEASGYLHADPMPIDFANLTFGESSSMTAIQMAKVFASIGNGGYSITPRVGLACLEEGMDASVPFECEGGTRLFSSETCQRVRTLMTDVVTRGTAAGTFGALGFNIGGKTGTAIDSFDDRRTFSFVGLAPCDDPEYVILVSIHKPETSITLSSSAARAANRIAARLLNRRGVKQSYTGPELEQLGQLVEVPDLSGMSIGDAALELLQLNLNPVLPLDAFYPEATLGRLVPGPGSKLGLGSSLWLYPEGEDEVEWVAVPDFQGCNYHECVWLAAEYGVAIVPDGLPAGIAVAQSLPVTSRPTPVAGEDLAGSPGEGREESSELTGRVKRGQIVTVHFSSSGPTAESGE